MSANGPRRRSTRRGLPYSSSMAKKQSKSQCFNPIERNTRVPARLSRAAELLIYCMPYQNTLWHVSFTLIHQYVPRSRSLSSLYVIGKVKDSHEQKAAVVLERSGITIILPAHCIVSEFGQFRSIAHLEIEFWELHQFEECTV